MDRYSKTVLTVIATALVVIAVENAIRSAAATNSEPQRVQICDTQQCAELQPITDPPFGSTHVRISWGLPVVAGGATR
jgi:hypothetical protein